MPDKYKQLEALCQKMVDGLLSESDFHCLEAMILQDASARQFYVEWMRFHASLMYVDHDVTDAQISNFLESLKAGVSLCPEAISDFPETDRSPFASPFSSESEMPFPLAVSSSASIRKGSKWEFATLYAGNNCTWKSTHTPTVSGTRLPRSRLELVTGIASVRFDRKTTIYMEGPCTVELVSDRSCRLRHGRIVAEVGPDGDEFTVCANKTIVTNGGTSLGAVVHNDMSSDICIFHGNAYISPMPIFPLKNKEGDKTESGSEKYRYTCQPGLSRFSAPAVRYDPAALEEHFMDEESGSSDIPCTSDSITFQIPSQQKEEISPTEKQPEIRPRRNETTNVFDGSFPASVPAIGECVPCCEEIPSGLDTQAVPYPLTTGDFIQISPHGDIIEHSPEKREGTKPKRIIRLSTANGRGWEVTIQPELSPDARSNFPIRSDIFLLLKNSPFNHGLWSRKVYFAIDLAEIQGCRTGECQLQLTFGPTGIGFLSRLPEEASFAVYGLTDATREEDWSPDTMTWENAPANMPEGGMVAPEQTELMGHFTIAKEAPFGMKTISGPALEQFISQRRGKLVYFVVVRETPENVCEEHVHGIANSCHPTLSPPTLRITLEK